MSVCLSVLMSVRPSVTDFDLNYLRTGNTEQAEIFLGSAGMYLCLAEVPVVKTRVPGIKPL